MTIRAAARIVVDALGELSPQETPPGKACATTSSPPAISAPRRRCISCFASRQVPLDPDIRDYAGASFPPGRPILAGAIDLMRRINDEFVYDAKATTVSTPRRCPSRWRRGVCQTSPMS